MITQSKQYSVFLSYSSKDASSARKLCSFIEENGLACFLAERDIPKGVLWAPFITDAISHSSVMVALYSENYNLSEEVDREITLASQRHIPILVYRIDMSSFEGTKAYYFSNLNWYSQDPELGVGSKEFVENLKKLLASGTKDCERTYVSGDDDLNLIAPSIAAANNGDIEAQFYLGVYYEGKGDKKQALAWYKKASDGGLASASYNYARILLMSPRSISDYREAFQIANEAASKGCREAAFLLAWCYSTGNGTELNYEEGKKYIMQTINESIVDPKSMGVTYYLLGNYYRFGYGNTVVSIKDAFAYWEKAAEVDNVDALYNIGVSYLNGDGVEKNEALAYSFLNRGLELGDVKCIRGVALCYRNGIHVKQDIHKSIDLYKKAADLGDVESLACIGSIYANGEGLPQDQEEGARWFLSAASKGHIVSQKNLAVMYFRGLGVPRNISESIKWFKKAAEGGDMESKVFLKQLEKN